MNKIGRSWSHLSEIKVGVGLEELELFCVEAAGFYSHCCARKNFLDSKIISDTFFLLQPAHYCMKEMFPIIPFSTFSFFCLSSISLLPQVSSILSVASVSSFRQETGDRVWAFPGFCNIQLLTKWGDSACLRILLAHFKLKWPPMYSSRTFWLFEGSLGAIRPFWLPSKCLSPVHAWSFQNYGAPIESSVKQNSKYVLHSPIGEHVKHAETRIDPNPHFGEPDY